MANVTGEAVDDVSSYMTAVWNNFNKDGTQSVEHFGDVMTKLGADTAASTEEIAGGLEKFAGVCDTIGLSFDYATSAITTIVDRTRQSEDVVGTALKTIFSRIQGLQQGETQDDGTTLNQYSEALRNVGINIKDANGELRDMDGILDDIGNKWDELDRANKVALAQKVAGIRQYTQFMALFDNWDFMEQNLDIAANADGTLNEQAEIYAESWEGARKRVQASAEEIYNSLIDKDFFIGVDNSIANILNSISDLINDMGGLKGVLLLIGTVATKVFKNQIASGLSAVGAKAVDLGVIVKNSLVDLTGVGTKSQTSTERMRSEAARQVQLQAQSIKNQTAATSRAGSLKDSFTNTSASLDATMYEKIGTLQQNILNNNKNLTSSEQQIIQTLMERQMIYQQVVQESQSELENDLQLVEKQQQLLQIKINTANIDSGYKTEYQEIQDLVKEYSELVQLINEANVAENAIDGTDESKQTALNAKSKVQDKFDNMVKNHNNTYGFADNFNILGEGGYDQAVDQAAATITEAISTLSNIAREDGLTGIANGLDNLNEKFIKTPDALKATEEASEQFGQGIKNTGDYVEAASAKVAGFSQNITTCTSGLTSLGFGLSSLESGFSSLKDIFENGLSFSSFSSALTSFSMGLPMVISGITNLSTGFVGLARNIEKSRLSSQQYVAQQLIEKATSEALLATDKAEDVMKLLQCTREEALVFLAKKKSSMNLYEAATEAGLIASKYASKKASEELAEANLEELGMKKLISKENIKQTGTNIVNKITGWVGKYGKYIKVLAKVAIVIAAITIAIKLLVAWWNKDANALKKAQEATENAKTSFENAKTAYEDLKSSINDYNDSVDAIKKLTKGTTEWKEAIQEANQQVIELLENYPALANYVTTNEDGLLEISEDGQDAILQEQYAKVQNSYRNYARKQQDENLAKNNNEITQFVRSDISDVDNEVERTIVNKVRADYEEKGNSIFAQDAEQFAAAYGTTVTEASELIDNGIYSLITSLDNNTNANDLLADQISSSALSQHMEGYDNFEYKSLLDGYLTDQTSDLTSDETRKAHSIVNNLNNDELAEAYAQLMGIDEEDITKRGGGNMTITDENGTETKVSKADMRSALYDEASTMVALPDVQKYSEDIADLNEAVEGAFDLESLGKDQGEKLVQGLTNAIGSNDASAISDFLGSLSKDEAEIVKKALEDGNLSDAIGMLYSNNAEYFAELGYQSGDDFVNAFKSKFASIDTQSWEESARQSEIAEKESWQSAVDDLSTELDVDSNAVEGYAETLQDLYPALEGDTEATMAMAKANIKFAEGFDTLVSALDDNEEALKDTTSTSWETQKALAEVGNAYEEMTGVNVSNNFISENLEDIKKLADGDMTVLEELGEAAAKDYVAHLEIPDEDISTFQSVLDQLKAEGADLAIGATVEIDDTQYIDKMNEMLAAGTITADQVKTAFNSMGYDPDIDYDTVKQTTTTHYDLSGDGLLGFLKGGVTANATTDVNVPVINAKGTKKISTPTSLGSSVHPSQTSSAKNKDSGSDNKQEMERYYTVSRQLEDLEDEYDRLSKARENAWGDQAIALIDKEIKQTDKLIKKNKEYLKQIKKNLASDKAKLKKYGAKFDEEGVITNYRTMFTKYGQNEEFNDAIKKYDETLDAKQKKEQDIEDEEIQKKELRFEKVKQSVEYDITINDNDLELFDRAIEDVSSDIYKISEAAAAMTSAMDTLTEEVKIYGQEFYDTQALWEAGDITQADAMEGYQEAYDGLLDKIDELKEKDEQWMEYYGNTLDLATEELSKYTDQIDFAIDKLEHFRKVQELSGSGTDYKTTLKFIKAQKEAYQDNYEIAKKWYDSRLADQKKIEAELAAIDKDANPYQYELIEEKLNQAVQATQDAYNEMAEITEAYLELAQEEFETTIDSIAEYAEENMTNGMGFDSLLDSMSNLSTYADEYLTKTNQLYETNKMMRTLEQDMQKTDNAAAKQKLSNFSKEIESAQKQNKLSNLELEILQAKYKQLQAQIALEEAQNAKSTVRLSRDTEGNYGYVYTADQDNIADAQQALDDADNDLYNIRLEAFNNYAQKKVQAEQELVEKIKEIYQDETLSAEEKEAEIARISKEYQDIINAYTDMSNIAQQEDARIQEDAWAAAYSGIILDAENWKNNIDQFLTESKAAEDAYHKSIDTMVSDTKGGYDDWDKSIQDTTTDLDTLKKKVNDEVIPALDDQIDKVGDSVTEYGKQRDKIQEVITKYKNLTKEIQAAMTALKNYHAEASKTVDTSGSGSGSGSGSNSKDTSGTIKTKDTIKTSNPTQDTKTSSKKYYVKVVNGNGTRLFYNNDYASMKKAKQAADGMVQSYNRQSNTKATLSEQTSGYLIKVLSGYQINGKGTYYSTYTAASKDAKKTSTIIGVDGTKYKFQHGGWYKSFDTGGYTGSWGNSGKLALLHEKELVLNADDTKNFLAGINILRDVVKSIDLQAMCASNSGMRAAGVSTSNQTLAQEVNITAEFPNATDHSEIEQAFDTLINRAAQYVNRK